MSISEPAKIVTPWASTGSKNPIPANANNTTGAAGFDKGFPDITMTPEEAGGLPPAGQDFNGIFYQITDIIRYIQAGGQPFFSEDLSVAIGGYPKGCMILGSDSLTLWQNQSDSNTNNPNASPTGWKVVDVGLRGDLLGSGGSSLVNFIQAGTGATARTTQSKLRERVTPLDFMTPTQIADVLAGTQLVDVSDAFIKAGNASNFVTVPGFKYLVQAPFSVLSGQTWLFEGAELGHTDDTKTIIRVNGSVGYSILGKVVLKGTLVSAAVAAETGLHITNGKRGRVEGVECRNFKGKGIWLDGSSAGALRGDRTQFTDCAAYECTVGRQVDAGAGAEYNAWVNFNASGNTTADSMAGGNNTTVGGSIVDNTVGVRLTAGANHCHGMYVGVNINHNSTANIHATGVTYGMDFVGCHLYGNGGATSKILLEGCKGIRISNGNIDCPIVNDSGAMSGMNYISNNYFPVPANVAISGTELTKLSIDRNVDPDGFSSLNDPAPVYVRVSRAISTQAANGGAVVVFNSEQKDPRGVYNPATGAFTAPVSGWYQVSVNLTVTGTALSEGYAEVKAAGVTVSFVPFVKVTPGNTIQVGSATVDVNLNAGQTLSVLSYAGGTSPLIAIDTSWLNVSLLA